MLINTSSFFISHRLAAGILCFNSDGLVLGINRRNSGLWGLPAGKCESGETLKECATRETLEETGLVATIVAPLMTAQSGKFWFTTFLADVGGILKASPEGKKELLINLDNPFRNYTLALFAKVLQSY
jgi:8-oxo-dGTP pyrophosphatase MutT (NUDIX family)